MSIDVEVPSGNFKGYNLNTRMQQPPDDELTKIGPGTPCGEYLRRYWHPIAMTEQITDLPLRIRRFGENLVLFKDKSGQYGCLHLHCSHRNTSLEFGIVEQKGLRCCYHGWLYDVDGTILETPGEPESSKIKHNVSHGAYPTIEYRGLVFAYFGPIEEMPTFPFLDHMDLGPEDEMVPFLIPNPCNWLQTFENSFDPHHTVHLHTRVSGAQFTDEFAVHPEFEIFERPYGYFYTNARRIGDKVWMRFHDHIPPNFSQNGSMFPDAKKNAYFLKAGLTRWWSPSMMRTTSPSLGATSSTATIHSDSVTSRSVATTRSTSTARPTNWNTSKGRGSRVISRRGWARAPSASTMRRIWVRPTRGSPWGGAITASRSGRCRTANGCRSRPISACPFRFTVAIQF